MKKATKKEILEIHQLFIERYDDAVTELTYTNAYELVIAVALSAQCTDKRVNILTPITAAHTEERLRSSRSGVRNFAIPGDRRTIKLMHDLF